MKTPLTDSKATGIIGFYSCETVPADFARKLERELNDARDQRDAVTIRRGQTQENLIDARKTAEHYRNLYYLPKDGLEAAKNHPITWECPQPFQHNSQSQHTEK